MIETGGELNGCAILLASCSNSRLLPTTCVSLGRQLIGTVFSSDSCRSTCRPCGHGQFLFARKLSSLKSKSWIQSKAWAAFLDKGLIELVKALLKFLISSVAILLFLSMEGEVMKLVSLNVTAIVRSGEMIIWAVLLLSMTLVLIAAIDAVSALSHNKQLKMTRKR